MGRRDPSYKTAFMLQCFATGQLALKLAAFAVFLYIIFSNLKDIALAQPGSLEGLAKIFNAIRLDTITSYVLTIGFGAMWYVERKQKKRAIAAKGRSQKDLEDSIPQEPGAAPWRTSSGLSLTGDNPGE